MVGQVTARCRRSARPAIRVAAVAAAAVVSVGAAAGCSRVKGDGIPDVTGAHRVADAAGHHWVALGRDWSVSTGRPEDNAGTLTYSIGTDGSRVIAVSVRAEIVTLDDVPPGELSALDPASGRRLWRTTFQWTPGTVPVGERGVVVLNSSRTRFDARASADYVAVDGATGKELWRHHVDQPVPSSIDRDGGTPGVFLGGLFYYADGSAVYGVDPRTGKVAHRLGLRQHRVLSGPVVGGGRLAFTTEPTFDNPGGTQELQVAGAGLAPVSSYVYPDTVDAANCAGTLIGGDLLVSSSDAAVCVFSLDGAQPRLLWSHDLGEQIPEAVVSGVVPLFDHTDEPNNTIVGLDARTGRTLWRTPPVKADIDGRSRVCVVDGTIFSLGHHVQIINPKTGKADFDATPATKGQNYGGDEVPVYVSGHIAMYRADGIWGFD